MTNENDRTLRAAGERAGSTPERALHGEADMAGSTAPRGLRAARGQVRAAVRGALAVLLSAVLVFGQAPAQLWAAGAEGIAEAVRDAAGVASQPADTAATEPRDEAATEQLAGSDAATAADDTADGTAAADNGASADAGTVTGDPADANADSSAPPADDAPAAADDAGGTAAADDAATDSGAAATGDGSADETSAAASGAEDTDPADTADAGDATAAQDPVDDGATDPATSASDAPARATEQVEATVAIIGIDARGEDETWFASTSYQLDAGSTAADLSEHAFQDAGLSADYGESAYGWYLNTVTAPDGRVLGWDAATGKYWQLFVNGEASSVGAGQVELTAGTQVVFYYSAFGDTLPGQISVTAGIIGQDASGAEQVWATDASYTVLEGATAASLTEQVFAACGITADYDPDGAYGWYLNTITSPFDSSVTLGYDAATGKYWQLFVNGEASDLGAGSVTLKAGDIVTWYYAAYGAELPGGDEPDDDPGAVGPDYDSSWPIFAGTPSGAVTQAPTPTESAEEAWTFSYGAGTGASDPLIINGDVYLVSGTVLYKVDGDTGAELARVGVGAGIRYFCRPAYDAARGYLIVPTDDGRLTAYTADDFRRAWQTDALASDEPYQALSSLTIAGDVVYAAFTAPRGSDPAVEGTLLCVSLADGSVVWSRTYKSSETGAAEGYYWAGAAVSGDDIIIGNEAGKVALVDGATGGELASVSVGSPCRAGIVVDPSDASVFYAVSRDDGALHKIVRTGDGLRLAGSVSFAVSSTSTPAVVDGHAYVCGVDAEGYGTLSVIDVATMTVVRTVRGGQGAAQGSPLVSVQGDGAYVYFTVNGLPGGVYGYRLGDDAAYLLYTPEASYQQMCTASIVADEQGNIYYTNDAGVLFKLSGRAGVLVSFDSRGGSEVLGRYVALGAPMLAPTDPVRAGYTFAGWFVDEACTVAWDFDDPVTGAMTLYAKWKPVSSGGEDEREDESDGSTKPPVTQVDTGNGGNGAGAAAGSAGVDAEDASVDDAEDAADDAAAPEEGVMLAAASARTLAAEGAAPEEGINAWAVAGVAAGVIGLAAIGAYIACAQRRRAAGSDA